MSYHSINERVDAIVANITRTLHPATIQGTILSRTFVRLDQSGKMNLISLEKRAVTFVRGYSTIRKWTHKLWWLITNIESIARWFMASEYLICSPPANSRAVWSIYLRTPNIISHKDYSLNSIGLWLPRTGVLAWTSNLIGRTSSASRTIV